MNFENVLVSIACFAHVAESTDIKLKVIAQYGHHKAVCKLQYQYYKPSFSSIIFTLSFKQLKDKEAQYMKALSDEWKRRDKEREILMQKRVCIPT